jgi:segregation and condensation protein B
LVRKGSEVAIGTRGEAGALIQTLAKEELSKDLGKAGLETIAIVLYQGPVTRARIDYIRGVNSSFMLRHLLVRGLVERTPNPEDQRSYLYQPSFALLQQLGLKRLEDLPNYEAFRAEAVERLNALEAEPQS